MVEKAGTELKSLQYTISKLLKRRPLGGANHSDILLRGSLGGFEPSPEKGSGPHRIRRMGKGGRESTNKKFCKQKVLKTKQKEVIWKHKSLAEKKSTIGMQGPGRVSG